MDLIGYDKFALAETLQDYGIVLAGEGVDYCEGVNVYSVCDTEAAGLFINLAMEGNGIPDINEWREHIQGMLNEMANYQAMTP
jgi:hypothetical protein